MQKGNILIYLLIIGLILAGIVGGYYLGIRKSAPPTQTQQTISQSPQPTLAPTPIPSSTTSSETANWQVYNNPIYRFSIQYPQDWVLVPFVSTDIIPAFKPKNDPNYRQAFASVLGIRQGCNTDELKNLTFEQWLKTRAADEVQGYQDIKSMETITGKSGVTLYKVAWNILTPHGSGDPVQVIYVKLPESINNFSCLEFDYGDKKYLSIVDQIISTFKFTN